MKHGSTRRNHGKTQETGQSARCAEPAGAGLATAQTISGTLAGASRRREGTTGWMAVRVVAACAALLWASAAMACEPVALPAGASGPDLCYGREVWRDATIGPTQAHQRFDFYRAARTTPAPLIIWAHPNGMSKTLPASSTLYQALVPPALQAGFSFASIEFRHPMVNENVANSATDPGVPHNDIARAIQFIRANADALGIDTRNIFLVGQSRGTLGVWTALQNDMAKPGSNSVVLRQSTRVNAVYAVNAQTSYDGQEFADLFLIPADRAAFVADFESKHPKHAQFGSAIRSVTAGTQADPPVKLIYDAPVINRQVSLLELSQYDALHYPNFGPALCNAYLRAFGNTSRCSYTADARFENDPLAAYAGYVAFFSQYLKP